MIGASAMNVSPPVAEQILTFLGILEAAKDPKAVKAFFADLQVERDKTRDAELAMIEQRDLALAARLDAQKAIDALPAAEARRAQIDKECAAALQQLSDARDDLERREQELINNYVDWRNETNATSNALAAEKRTLAQSWDELGLARSALVADQVQVDVAYTEVDALRATYEAKLAKLRAATEDA